MVNHLGVVGAPTMGAGIAQAAALSGIDVILYDVNDTILRQSLERVKNHFKKGIEKGKLTQEQTTEAFSRIHPRTKFADFSHSEIVIEKEIKQGQHHPLRVVCHRQTGRVPLQKGGQKLARRAIHA